MIQSEKIITLEELNKLASLMPVPFIVFNQHNVLYFNEPFRILTGYHPSELNIDCLHNFIHPEQRIGFFHHIEKVLNKESAEPIKELRLLTKDGHILWIDYQVSLISCQNQDWVLVSYNDITDKKINQQALRRLIKLRESMLEIAQSVIGVVHMDHVYDMVLEKAIESIDAAEVGSIMLRDGPLLRITAHRGFDNEAIQHFSLPIEESFLYKATQGQLNYIALIDDIETLEDVYSIPLEEDSTRMIRSSITAPIIINGDFFGVVDVEATKTHAFTEDDVKIMQFIRNNVEIAISSYLLYEEKHFLSQYDSLTGLYNRTFFEEIFQKVLEKSKRYEEPFHLVLFDLNSLKVVNDHLGHMAGDQLLKQFSESLQQTMRKSDLLARYGGDEFIGIFHHANEAQLHERLLSLLTSMENQPIYLEGLECICSYSYGMATFNKDGLTLQELVRTADRRMYEFKKSYKAAQPKKFPFQP